MEELGFSSGSEFDSSTSSSSRTATPSTPGLTPELEQAPIIGEAIITTSDGVPLRSDYFDDPPPPLPDPEDPSGRVTPPPTYDDCMKKAIPLSFMDFWPQCLHLDDAMFIYARFESFGQLVDAANRWLQDHSEIVVRNCETVEIKVTSMDEYLSTTATKPTIYRSRFMTPLYIKGLRVWYSSAIINRLDNRRNSLINAPSRIGYVNIRPARTEHCQQHEVRSTRDCEKFPELVEKMNAMIRNGEIKGHLLCAESVFVKEPNTEDSSCIRKLDFDPDQTSWRDRYNKVAVQFLRVYYLAEQEAHTEELLRYKDFLPMCLRRSKHHPKYSDFTDIMDDARVWLLQQNKDFRLMNAQTIDTKYPGHKNNLKPDANAMLHVEFETVPRVRFLRLYWTTVTDLHESSDYADDEAYLVPLLSHRTFVPVASKRRHHEPMGPLMRRTEHWLRATGANVICAETLPLLESDYHNRGEIDSNVFRYEGMDGDVEYSQHQTLLYVVRVYLDTVYPEPKEGDDDDLDEECVIL